MNTKIDQRVRVISVVFDICASSVIVEELGRAGKLKVFVEVLSAINSHLERMSKKFGFTIYKFMGDGWILLLPVDIEADVFVNLLSNLSGRFETLYQKKIARHIRRKLKSIGLKYGVAIGLLAKIKMRGRWEYVGRSLTVAARLEGAIKDKDSNPQNKVLITFPAYKKLGLAESGYVAPIVSRRLRNILDGELKRYRKLRLNK